LPDTTGQQIAAAADALMAAYRKGASWMTSPPMEFDIAEQYIRHKIRLLQVPSLVKQGIEAMTKMYVPNLPDDRMDEASRNRLRDSMDGMRIQAAHILLDCYAATRQAQKSRRYCSLELQRGRGYRQSRTVYFQAPLYLPRHTRRRPGKCREAHPLDIA
jgi:hypothetical protein